MTIMDGYDFETKKADSRSKSHKPNNGSPGGVGTSGGPTGLLKNGAFTMMLNALVPFLDSSICMGVAMWSIVWLFHVVLMKYSSALNRLRIQLYLY